jgi:hypothetical protein
MISLILLETADFMADAERQELGKDFRFTLWCEEDAVPAPKTPPMSFYVGTTADMRKCLPQLLSKILPSPYRTDDLTSILIGLSNCAGWRSSTEDETRAYELAAALLYFVDCFWSDHPLDKVAEPVVCEMLNVWLNPRTQWLNLPSTGVLCQHMFNAAWCDLALPDGCFATPGTEVEMHEIGELVYRERPPFLPGVCSVQKVQVGAGLMLPSFD